MFVLSSSINAQGNGKKGNKPDFTPDQIATLQVKKLNLQLDLNKSQQDAIFKLQKNQALTRQAMQKAMQERKLDGNRPTTEERFQLKSTRLDMMQQHKLAMQKILTPDQFTKWETMARSKLNRKNGCNNQNEFKGNRQGRQR